jgi:hypothetical protein
MTLVEIVLLVFTLIGVVVLGVAFWASLYPTILCQKVNSRLGGHNVCIRHKNHLGHHMNVNGEEFICENQESQEKIS